MGVLSYDLALPAGLSDKGQGVIRLRQVVYKMMYSVKGLGPFHRHYELIDSCQQVDDYSLGTGVPEAVDSDKVSANAALSRTKVFSASFQVRLSFFLAHCCSLVRISINPSNNALGGSQYTVPPTPASDVLTPIMWGLMCFHLSFWSCVSILRELMRSSVTLIIVCQSPGVKVSS